MEESRVSMAPITNRAEKKKPKGNGRKKIEIKKIEKTSSRRVAFSKRRRGLFNKAAEICRLCDARIAIVVFSPTGRLYSFGHPSPDEVIDRLLYEDNNEEETELKTLEMVGGAMEREIKEEEEEEMAGETMEAEELPERVEKGFWWEESIEDLGLEEVEKYKSSLEELRNNVVVRLEEMIMRRTYERDFLCLI